ncbi:MAG: ABC transporter ATP-binding protein [Mariprofundales bacterium]
MINVKNAIFKAGGNNIVDDISINLHAGELCAMIGPSGAGKSSLIKLLLGMRTPTSGTVSIAGSDANKAGPIAYVPQDDVLHSSLGVEQSLDFAARLRLPTMASKERRKLIQNLLHKLDLHERSNTRIHRLSGGQRKRVSIGVELLNRPKLMILDEPTSGLDPGMESRMMQLFASIAADGCCVLLSTHSMQSLSYCQALLILMQGKNIYFGRSKDALRYFQVKQYEHIFRRLQQKDAKFWGRRFQSLAYRKTFMQRKPAQQVQQVQHTKSAVVAKEKLEKKVKEDAQAILARLKKSHSSEGRNI